MTKARLFDIDRAFEIGIVQSEPKAAFIDGLAHSKAASFAKVLAELSLDELRHICRVHELPTRGKKAELQARIRGEQAPKRKRAAGQSQSASDQSELFAPEQLDDQLAAFLARSQPSVSGIIPRLPPRELSSLLRRLKEQHEISVDLSAIDPGPDGLGRALEQVCELAVLLGELDRDQLSRVCQYYGLSPAASTREGYLRTLLAAAAGVTEDEAAAIEAEQADDEPSSANTPPPDEPEQKPPEEDRPSATSDDVASVDPLETTPEPSKPNEPPSAAQTAPPQADERPATATDASQAYRQSLAALPRSLNRRLELDSRPTDLPAAGDLVRVRQRQYLVTAITPPLRDAPSKPGGAPPAHMVDLVCLDDDAQGRELKVLWEVELGAQRIDPARKGLGDIDAFDSADRFAAYYRALQWNCVTTATKPEEERVQAPFRAGIAVMQHQLVPLLKALALPRANLFIADDVGLGKTIEAGLIVQELLLRQRLELLLIVCPASIALQWQGEMERRFGVRFEIVNREFMARVRKERGFVTNPWTCGRRFIVSYQTLRRPEYREGLLAALGEPTPRSMLILDEAHTVAPASPGRYAIDSQLTKLARSLAPRFENRLFLSATPHNGHSNSFSALLELLDPIRFTRGVPVDDRASLDAVMVRRLKRDLEGVTALKFPTRKVVELRIERENDRWQVARAETLESEGKTPSCAIAPAESAELELSELLREYTELCAPRSKRDRMVFIGLQKRLLSSVAAFAHTLQVHLQRSGQKILEALEDTETDTKLASDGDTLDAETYGEELDAELERRVSGASRKALPADQSVRAQAEGLLERMQELTRGARRRPTGKFLALLDWVREHQCPAAGKQWLASADAQSTSWTETRLIIFTEYAHTAGYLLDMLRAALADTDREDERIAYFHGAMSDDQRRELQANFNAPPHQHPVRILVATDAAREGVNLQAHCADLIHYDIPWNPGRLEQRNGRIDRTLQPSPEVRCMYFHYPQRSEDRVLRVLVEKVERITRELGSLSAVVLDRIEDALEPHGIDGESQQRLDLASEGPAGAKDAAIAELEHQRGSNEQLRREIEVAADCHNRSKVFFAPDAEALRDTLAIALGMAGAQAEGRFVPVGDDDPTAHDSDSCHYRVPDMPDDWQRTLDTLRPPRPRDEAPWDWRRKSPPKPVVFEPLSRMTDEVVQLHLEHPFVKRALARFTAQGYGAHDLKRATLLRYEGSHERLVLIGRLSLFGRGATRLHDSLVHLVAEVREGQAPRRLVSEAARDKALDDMRSALHRRKGDWQPAPAFVHTRLEAIAGHLRELWPQVKAEAEDLAAELERLLDDRGARESEALEDILDTQMAAIARQLQQGQSDSAGEATGEAHPETRQRRLDRKHMEQRLQSLRHQQAIEPQHLREHYEVLSTRIEAVGLVYLVPATR